MAHHSVSTIQLISTALTVATLVSVCALFVVLFFMNKPRPPRKRRSKQGSLLDE